MPSAVAGYSAALVAVLGFGSNFIPAKRINSGDGMFFQWCMCCAIWMTGLLTQIGVGKLIGGAYNPSFEPFAMLGGFFWCTGNCLALVVINLIGMGLGLLIWGATNMLCGWASGTWGWFGIEKDEVSNPVLNYLGVVVAVVALLLYMNVGTEDSDEPSASSGPSGSSSGAGGDLSAGLLEDGVVTPSKAAVNSPKEDSGAGTGKRILGMGLAALAGCCMGFNFDPVEVLKADGGNHSPNSVDYTYSHFSGIFLSSSVYLILYCANKFRIGETPYVTPDIVIPAILAGLGWAIAEIAWFIGNDNLSLAVSFPIITSGPGIVGAIWGVFLFQEVKGRTNLLRLVAACCTSVVAVVMIALSK